MISFFLKTRASAVPKKGICRDGQAYNNPTGMDVGGDDSSFSFAHTNAGVDDNKAAIEEQLARMRQEQHLCNICMQQELQNSMQTMMQGLMQAQLQAQQQVHEQTQQNWRNQAKQPACDGAPEPTNAPSPKKRKAPKAETVPNDAASVSSDFFFASPSLAPEAVPSAVPSEVQARPKPAPSDPFNFGPLPGSSEEH